MVASTVTYVIGLFRHPCTRSEPLAKRIRMSILVDRILASLVAPPVRYRVARRVRSRLRFEDGSRAQLALARGISRETSRSRKTVLEKSHGMRDEMTALSLVSDKDLLDRVPRLVLAERGSTADVIQHLMEIDRRRIYLDAACRSLAC